MSDSEEKSVLKETAEFISEYIATLLGSGVHTSRVVRNSRRIAESLGIGIQISVFHRTVILNMQKGERQYSKIVDIPALPINFRYNSKLSALSWEAHDERLSLAAIRERFERILSESSLNPLVVMLMAAAANASFCQLFGGDWLSTLIVFGATLAGFSLRRVLQKRGTEFHITTICTSFVSSLIASTALLLNTATADIAITTSVLFQTPGVLLIHGVIDIVEGYILGGFVRLTKAMLIIFCIAVGLSFTLWIVKNGLI
jgi:uncharacterized membrane protein YjjP (DUF1212 family)